MPHSADRSGNNTLSIFFLFILLCCLSMATPSRLAAHPHAFVEAFVAFVFDKKGLAGIRQRWILDEMLTTSILDLSAENHDGRLDEQEVAAVKQNGLRQSEGI